MLTRTGFVSGLSPLALLGAGASAQEAYRPKLITLVVPFPPDGLGDTVRRVGKFV